MSLPDYFALQRGLLRLWRCLAFLFALLYSADALAQAQGRYAHFEARQTHPITLSLDQSRLLALNSPDARLSVFEIAADGSTLIRVAEIPVGLEPVSVRARTDDEAWVVNEVSDSISIISLSKRIVHATLHCPDEPADVVFASGKAFVTCARNSVIRVFDVSTLAEMATIPLQGNYPRSLTINSDGTKIYCVFQTGGNGSTAIPPELAPDPPSPERVDLPQPPRTGLIVHSSDPRVAYKLLDHDVAEISVQDLRVTAYFSNIGTTMFEVARQPGTDLLWIGNTDALNYIRFEPSLNGLFADNRLTQLNPSNGSVLAHNLDIKRSRGETGPVDRDKTLAQPMSLEFSSNGLHCWIAAFGSDRIAKFSTARSEAVGWIDLRLATSGKPNHSSAMRGPRGLAFHERNQRLYVLNKLSNTLSVIDSEASAVLLEMPIGSFDPTPAAVKEGRGFLFDARLSGNGKTSCATCHIDADRDGLAWDLGNPAGEMLSVMGANLAAHDTRPRQREMHPMKGPMVTQTLRGLQTNQLFHWRGDRASLRDFSSTFRDLMGGTLLPDADMDAMKSYLDTLRHHPNPNRTLENRLPVRFGDGDPTRGRSLFVTHVNHCGVCHTLPTGSDNNIDDVRNFGGLQPMKTPPLQTLYQRALLDTRLGATNTSGFGLGHDGTGGKQFLPTVHFYELDELEGDDFTDVTAFLMCFETGTAPAVGRSYSFTRSSITNALSLNGVSLLENQARSNYCDLVIRGRFHGEPRAFHYDPATDRYRPDSSAAQLLSRSEILSSLYEEDGITFLGVLPGDGSRFGGDRDRDGILDGDNDLPRLECAQESNFLSVTWNERFEDWAIESASRPGGPWFNVHDLPRKAGGMFQVRITPTTQTEFFRLRRTW